MLGNQATLREGLGITRPEAHVLATRVILRSASISRKNNSLQDALSTLTYLSRLATEWERPNLQLRAAVDLEIADVLWKQNETAASVRMLRETVKAIQENNVPIQAIEVGRSGLLAKLVSLATSLRGHSTNA